jgi:hypothetical protein
MFPCGQGQNGAENTTAMGLTLFIPLLQFLATLDELGNFANSTLPVGYSSMAQTGASSNLSALVMDVNRK